MEKHLTREEAIELVGLDAVECVETIGAHESDSVGRPEDGIHFEATWATENGCIIAHYYQPQAERDAMVAAGNYNDDFENWTVDHYEVV